MSTAPKAAPPAPRRVPCPRCRTPALFGPSNRWRPFCSERCRNLDLGAWASESYRVPSVGRDTTDPGEDDTTAG
jgi:endogenous inhibitor of DNA gyrase (YacG/DUF329 family)